MLGDITNLATDVYFYAQKTHIMFKSFNLNQKIIKAINLLGYEKPTQIQELTIPHILDDKRDLVALAQTGTGKTAGFGLPILNQINTNSEAIQALILSPTRELALQIANDLQSYSKFIKEIRIVAIYGGASIEKQISDLKKGAHIVVGTPGRTLDLIKRRKLNIQNIKWLVLDEADEMLNMGFRDELDAILEKTPQTKQTLLFSATMPAEVKRIASRYLHNPIELVSGKRNTGAKNVEHEYYVIKERNRYSALKRLVDYEPNIYGIIFCRTRAQTREIAAKLIDDGYSADAIHGDLSQTQRDFVMRRFRTRQIQLLVATDVAARGIDVADLTHIIHYNLPDDPEVYIHRSGRTGRAGKTGTSQVLVTPSEATKIPILERITSKKFTKKNIPTGKEIYKKRLFAYATQIENTTLEQTDFDAIFDQMAKSLQWLDKEELIKRVFYIELQRFMDYMDDDTDINVKEFSKHEKKSKRDRKSKYSNRSQFTRYFINIGKKNDLNARKLISLVNQLTDSNDIEIGKIDIQRNFSFFDVDKKAQTRIEKAFRNAKYNSIHLHIEKAKKRRVKIS